MDFSKMMPLPVKDVDFIEAPSMPINTPLTGSQEVQPYINNPQNPNMPVLPEYLQWR